MNNTVHFMVISSIIVIGIVIIKYITLTYSTFIGSKSRIYVVCYNLICALIHTIISIELLIVLGTKSINVLIATPYVIYTIYLDVKLNYKIYKILIENKDTIIIISMIQTSLVNKHRVKESKIKCLLNNMEKVEFKITRRDANKIDKLLKSGAIISKVHYYKTSMRLYGIEVLQYN